MTLRPCLDCGEPADGPRCSDHTIDTKPSATARGYDATWSRLSKRARKLQPFCTDCGSTEALQLDHSPEAWQRKAEGKAIRLEDVAVVCGPCNRSRGAARGHRVTRGVDPSTPAANPRSSQSFDYSPVGRSA